MNDLYEALIEDGSDEEGLVVDEHLQMPE